MLPSPMLRSPKLRMIAVLSLALVVAGCGGLRESRLNPWNWFGRSAPVEKVVLPQKAADPRPLVPEVAEVVVEPIRSGAIIRATGLPPTQGWWDAELIAQPVDENGRLVVEFRIIPPRGQTDVNTRQSCEITAALHLSHIRLEQVREIIVQGAGNARAVRR